MGHPQKNAFSLSGVLAHIDCYVQISAMQSIKATVERHGFAFVKGDSEQIEMASIINFFGSPLTPWDGGLIQELIPRSSSTPNTYSGIFGMDRFPFHSDLAHWVEPPRYLLLRCVKGYHDVPTLVVDGDKLVDEISFDILARAIFKPRRPRDGTLTLLRLCEPTEEGYRLRWDEVFLKPASKIGQIAHDAVQDWLAHCEPIKCVLESAGDILLIDNWRMLHARAPIPVGREDRKIQRVYLRSLH